MPKTCVAGGPVTKAEIEPGAAMPWLSLAIALHETGRNDEARAALAEARRHPLLPEWAADLALLIDSSA